MDCHSPALDGVQHAALQVNGVFLLHPRIVLPLTTGALPFFFFFFFEMAKANMR